MTYKIKPKSTILKVSSPTKGQVNFSWTNVTGESGYEVYYSTKLTGTYQKVGTYKANTTNGSIKNLTSGKKYYFKVRAFTETGNGKIYSSYSAKKAITVR